MVTMMTVIMPILAGFGDIGEQGGPEEHEEHEEEEQGAAPCQVPVFIQLARPGFVLAQAGEPRRTGG